MDCNASDASVADWLEERFRDELKLVEGRQQALLTELRLHLRQVQPAVHAVHAVHAVRVIPPELSGSLSPSLDVKTARGVLRPPEAVKSESEQVGVGKGWQFGVWQWKTMKLPYETFMIHGIVPRFQSLSFIYVQ